jgi:hypothetical protein
MIVHGQKNVKLRPEESYSNKKSNLKFSKRTVQLPWDYRKWKAVEGLVFSMKVHLEKKRKNSKM